MSQSDTATQLKTTGTPLTPGKRTRLLTLEDYRKLLARTCTALGSQQELARKAGVTGQFIGHILSGKKNPGPKLLAALNARAVTLIEVEEESE